MPGKWAAYAGSFAFFCETWDSIILATYFWGISKYWWKLQAVIAVYHIALYFLLLTLPESPKFLYEKKQFAKVKDILIKIAKWNGVEY